MLGCPEPLTEKVYVVVEVQLPMENHVWKITKALADAGIEAKVSCSTRNRPTCPGGFVVPQFLYETRRPALIPLEIVTVTPS